MACPQAPIERYCLDAAMLMGLICNCLGCFSSLSRWPLRGAQGPSQSVGGKFGATPTLRAAS